MKLGGKHVSVALVRERAVSALAGVLTADGIVLDKGYTTDLLDNLVAHEFPDSCRRDYQQGDGHELEHKMKAPHSSSALVVNTFCPWKASVGEMTINRRGGFDCFGFEVKCSTGLGGTPPNLDVLAKSPELVLAIESKCTEYLSDHKLNIPDSYEDLLGTHPRLAAVRAAARVKPFQRLDVSQLVKHALGLACQYPDRSVLLVYLFWEPRNWRDYEEFRAHRAEVRRFANLVEGDCVRFAALTYRELWNEWALRPGPSWLAGHVDRLEARYDVTI